MKNLKIGLEIHIQLDTGKLFCPCRCDISNSGTNTFTRTLYPTSGELGKTDRAALFELSRGRLFEYAITGNSCLVEMDEEPPHEMNGEAVKVALSLAVALNCQVFPEVFVMRKIVVDGSNTTGFQRTSLVGVDGKIDVDSRKIGITAICLEEDSARKLSQEGGRVNYSLDRLGIPLVEISTDPDIKTPEEAMDVAREIGYMAASTGMVRQGAESIRQDVNMSLGYGRVEIKGVSRLSLIREVIVNEMERQTNLSDAVSILKERGNWNPTSLSPVDVSDMFMKSESKIIAGSLKRKEKIIAFTLRHLKGLLKKEKFRVGREIADALKPYGIMGILHGDELPGYGIGNDLIKKVIDRLKLGSDDSFALVGVPEGHEKEVMETVKERIEKLLSLDFSETRAANTDGTTSFLRPLPGRERMYPETDIPTFRVSEELLAEVRREAPKSFEEQVQILSAKYSISKQDVSTIIRNGNRESLVKISKFVEPKLAARILIHTIPQIEKDLSVTVDKGQVELLAKELSSRDWVRFSIEPALRLIYTEKMNIKEVMADRRIVPLSREEIVKLLRKISGEGVKLNKNSVILELKKRSERPFDPVLAMGVFNDPVNL